MDEQPFCGCATAKILFAFPIFVSYSELGIDLERKREKKGHHIRLRENDDLPLW